MASDAALVARSAGGDRGAFEQIVARYQGLVCAVALSATRDRALSEDVAQEALLPAWRGIGGLRDPARLKAWLCGIARNRAADAARRRAREGRPSPLDEAGELKAPTASPLQAVLEREQEAVVWRALGELPENYREPLVLFYREQRSVVAVAEALELSEEAVRQRLARGRQMLKEHVSALVETTLARTRPGRALTVAVMAALPAIAPQAAAAGVAAAAAEGSPAASATAATGLAGAVFGPLLGVAGAYVGAKASLEATRSPRERAFVARSIRVFTAYVLGFLGVQAAGLLVAPRVVATLPAQLVLWSAYSAGLVALIVRHNRRQRRIQVEDGTFAKPHPGVDPARTPRGAIHGSVAGGVFGSVCWIFPMSAIAGEWAVGVAVLVAALLAYVVVVRATLRRPERYFRIQQWDILALGALNLLVINLRWEAWMEAYRRSRFYEPISDLPLWAMNVLMGALVAWLFLRFGRLHRAQAGEAKAPARG